MQSSHQMFTDDVIEKKRSLVPLVPQDLCVRYRLLATALLCETIFTCLSFSYLIEK